MLHRYLVRRLGPDEAEGMVGEIFRIAFEKRASYDLDRSLAAVPTHGGSLQRRESQLAQLGDHAGIGEMYAELASHRPRGEQPPL